MLHMIVAMPAAFLGVPISAAKRRSFA